MRLFTRIFLGYFTVILVTGVGVAIIAGFISPGIYRAHLDQVGLLLRPEFVRLRISLEEGYQQTMLQALGIALPISMFLAVGFAYFQTRRLVRSFQKLADGSREIAHGQYDKRLKVAGNDELAALSTDFNRMAEALEKAEKRRVELIGTVAHELKAPLAVQQGYTEALMDEMVSSKEAARAIMHEISAMRRLTNDLLLLTKIEAGAFELQLAPCLPEDLIVDVLDRFLYAFDEKGLVLETDVPKRLTPVYADRERFGQILGNLLSNALRYTPSSGRVILRAQPCNDGVEFSIADTGQGIPLEHQSLIFRRFYRVESSAQDDSGTGIGLTVAQGLVKAMGGRMWLQSHVGQGTTFYFTLPAARQS